jgi:hypothetical protein
MTFVTNPDFSKYEVVARPCPDREARIFKTDPSKTGTCYRAYSLALAKEQFGRDHVILVEHGGGRELLRIKEIYGAEADWLLTLDERRQYAALWALYATADRARTESRDETAGKYARAFAEGRLKKRRRNRRAYVEIEPPAIAADPQAA